MKNIEKVAQIIKLLVLDVDGVMTDGSIYLDAEQELFKSFNAKDGMGISCAIRCGLQVAIITGRCSPIIRRRARELGIVEVCENVKEKRSALAELLQKYNLSLNETAYVGDDLNDLPVLTQVGLACAPADAVEEVKQVCHFVKSTLFRFSYKRFLRYHTKKIPTVASQSACTPAAYLPYA